MRGFQPVFIGADVDDVAGHADPDPDHDHDPDPDPDRDRDPDHDRNFCFSPRMADLLQNAEGLDCGGRDIPILRKRLRVLP